MFFRPNSSRRTAEHQGCPEARACFEIHADAQIPADFFVSHTAGRRIRTIFIPGMNDDLPVKYPSRIYSLTADELCIFPPKSTEAGPMFFRLSTLKAIHSYRAPLFGALEFEGDTSAQFFYCPVHRSFIDSFLRSVRRYWLSSPDTSGQGTPQPVPGNVLNKIQEHLLNSELDPEEAVLSLSIRSVTRRKPRFYLGRQQKGASACLVLTDRRLLVITSDETSHGLPSFVSIHSVRSGGVCVSSDTDECLRNHTEFEAARRLGKMWTITIPVHGFSEHVRPLSLLGSANDWNTLSRSPRPPQEE